MDNVIKQGYLKKGSASDNLFSGLIEKMTPRKWFMLVVRNRIPYFEQYERDVDVFSSTPVASHNLSTCTSISRSMSQSSRTCTFVIVLPDILIELTASTREAMIDWCDALERTLASLGIMKREREEHVYSFCPAVMNLTGHSKKRSDDDEKDEDEQTDETLWAVGGAAASPFIPPPIRQHPPPLPTGHPSAMTRNSAESSHLALNNLSPPPLPSAGPPPLPCSAPKASRRSGSPTSLQPPTEFAPPPPPHHSKTVLPLPPDLPLPPLPSSSQSGPAPPLPPGRPLASAPVMAEPPPLPPGRSHSSEPRPPPRRIDSSPGVITSVAQRDRAARKDSLAVSDEGRDSDDESTDYSSDFVSGAFWEINRKIPVPTARRPVLASAGKLVTAAPSSAGEYQTSVPKQSFRGDTQIITESAQEDLDEGYSDLKTVLNFKKSHSVGAFNKDSEQNVQAGMKKSASDMFGLEGDSDKMVASAAGLSGASSTSSGQAQVSTITANAAGNTAGATSGGASSSIGYEGQNSGTSGVSGAGRESARAGDPSDNSENFYAPFPVQDSYATPSKLKVSGGAGSGSKQSMDETSLKTSPARNSDANDRSSSPEIESTCFSNDFLDDVYTQLSEASSFPDPSDGSPPLPPRLDSLHIAQENASKANAVNWNLNNDKSVSSDPPRPVPTPRKSANPQSPSLPPLPVIPSSGLPDGNFASDGRSSQDDTKFAASSENPPSLPPRGGLVYRGQSVDSTLADPPPLPSRKAQSFRHQRPLTLPAMPGNGENIMTDSHNADFLEESSEFTPSVRRQHSGSGADAGGTENHLRQRQRLDRVHSMHAVVSLKQSQAEILKQEMELPGVTVTISKMAAQGIGLVDCREAVCVAGWNQIDFPSLHGKFHIGDQVISICNQKVTSAAVAQKMLKHPPSEPVEMLVNRTPHARVLAIRRVAEGQNIGIKRSGGTAEILYVDPNGLAAQNGLPLHAPGVLSDTRSNWMLTEINSRHLSLFFKDVEIEHRLNAVGREITIVVQPADYIQELKRQLKKLKNYKNLIVS